MVAATLIKAIARAGAMPCKRGATSRDSRAELDATLPGVRVRATARATGRTGVEMEALTAVAVALLTVYDMVKAADRGMELGAIRLLEKSGGKSGSWRKGAIQP